MAISWRDAMSVDNGPIDNDHRHLIGIINEFSEAKPRSADLAKLHGILDELDHYAKTHFAREESLQRSVRYTYADAHRHEHENLVVQLDAMRAEFTTLTRAAPASPEQPTADASAADVAVAAAHAKMAAFLGHWLIDHILKSDLRMKPFVAPLRVSGQAG